MADPGKPVDLIGTLIRDTGGFSLRAEGGAVFHLQLRRVPVDEVEKRVRVIGTLIGDQMVEAEGVAQI